MTPKLERLMRPLALSLSGLYILHLSLCTVVFVLALPVVVPMLLILKKGRLDDAIRLSNYLYGAFLIRMSWPVIRLSRSGKENLPKSASSVIVVNHRSTADMFFGPFFTTGNTTVFVRSWPFRLWGFGWFMRRAKYIDVEKMDMPRFIEGPGRDLCRCGVSFLVYPEGHRSRTGRLQPFQSGAFVMAAGLNIPVVPVCMTGTEVFLSMKDPIIRPTKVEIRILPPIEPSSFPEERRAIKLKKHVEDLIRVNLNE